MINQKLVLFPAIDLKDGACVRLEQGDMERATKFNDDPTAQACAFQAAGFDWLHLVDLDGAFEGRAVNQAAVEAILGAISIPAQLGGGIRNMRQVELWMRAGLARVILGTAAVRDPEFVKTAAREFPGQVAVGIDARGGKVAVEGWAETSELLMEDLARRFEDAGINAIIYTDIDRDGILTGLNLASTLALAAATSIPVIASGGLADIKDIEALKKDAEGVLEGAISGRALYDGRLDPKAALDILSR